MDKKAEWNKNTFVCFNDTGFQVIFLSQITMKQIYLTRIQILAGHLTVCC